MSPLEKTNEPYKTFLTLSAYIVRLAEHMTSGSVAACGVRLCMSPDTFLNFALQDVRRFQEDHRASPPKASRSACSTEHSVLGGDCGKDPVGSSVQGWRPVNPSEDV